MRSFKRLLQLALPYWRSIIVLYMCNLGFSFATVLAVGTLGQIMTDNLAGSTGLSYSGLEGRFLTAYPTIYLISVFLVIAFIIKGIFGYLQNYWGKYLTQRIILNLRIRLYSKLQTLSLSFYDRNKSGQLISKVTNDVAFLQHQLTSSVTQFFIQPLTIVILLVYGAVIYWKMVVMILFLAPLISFFIQQFSKRMRKIGRRIQIKAGDILQVLVETISAIRVVRAFNTEKREISRFNEENRKSFKALMKGARLKAAFTPVVELTGAFFIALVLFYVGYEMLRGNLQQQDIGTLLVIFLTVGEPIRAMSISFSVLPHTLAAVDRIYSIFDEVPDVQEAPTAYNLPPVKGEIVFSKVSFGYEPGVMVLKEINLKINPGESVALVGPSGAGKTTIANLIPRFYDPVAGAIYLDGHNLKDVTFSSLRRQIGIVAQETILFAGTIAENIAYGKPGATREEIIAAAKIANAHDFITALPEGYQTVVGERGVSLSGGQRQRIAIARAVLLNPRILILDEATSSLDSESEALVQEALGRIMEGRTSVVIAHRLSTARRTDRIIVLADGEIREEGPHEQLIKQPGLYRELYQKQFQDI